MNLKDFNLKNLKDKNLKELKLMETQVVKYLFDSRLNQVFDSLKEVKNISFAKKSIARIKTLIKIHKNN